ncbi:MAG: hypothetical protein P8Y45_18040 [Exilibacterium sp.]
MKYHHRRFGNKIQLADNRFNNAMMEACWFAAVKVGAVVVLSMPVHRAKELSDMVKTAQIRQAICDQRCVEELQLIRRRGSKLEKVMTFSGANQLRQLMVSKPCEFNNVKIAWDQVCQISFSMAASGNEKSRELGIRWKSAIGRGDFSIMLADLVDNRSVLKVVDPAADELAAYRYYSDYRMGAARLAP